MGATRKARIAGAGLACLLMLGAAVGLTPAGCDRRGEPAPVTTKTERGGEDKMVGKVLEGKKVLMIIAQKNFRDEELAEPRAVLEAAGAQVTVGAASLRESVGMLGAQVKPDVALSEVKAADYDAVIFVGGGGATQYWQDPTAHRLAREAQEAGEVLGAICLAPGTLAGAGLLEGKKATAYASAKDACIKGGARWTGSHVEVDGRIITADGPQSARKFGEAIRDALAGN